MKKNIHPRYAPVVFRDTSTGHLLLTRSTLIPDRTVEYEGQSYPVIDVEISSDSHPFWTGTARTLDAEGRVERFRRRYQKRPVGSATDGKWAFGALRDYEQMRREGRDDRFVGSANPLLPGEAPGDVWSAEDEPARQDEAAGRP